ncbi:hypothetical protein BaRGS_00026179 [Batillaria attramentaria]|uniref:Secreted protein n=1 Tax=Batillaria attramentaria TaxID=370345 RepID=A0ABD0K6T2_9CAEN
MWSGSLILTIWSEIGRALTRLSSQHFATDRETCQCWQHRLVSGVWDTGDSFLTHCLTLVHSAPLFAAITGSLVALIRGPLARVDWSC